MEHGLGSGAQRAGFIQNLSAGFSVDEMVAQHLLWRLARKHKLVFVMMAAHAPYHSSWHWEAEQPWSLVRRCIAGKHFGRADFECDPGEIWEREDKEGKAALLQKITASAIKE